MRKKSVTVKEHPTIIERINGKLILTCPSCGTMGEIDENQLEGKVSTMCRAPGCAFHETVVWKKYLRDEK